MSSRVQVTYSGPISFTSSEQWKNIKSSLQDLLPLRNLHWKSATRPSIRTIQELDVDLVPLESVKDEATSQVPTSLLERPFLNIFALSCEDTDIYKNTVKKQIKEWHSLVIPRRNQEWLIILVGRPDSRTAGSRLFQIKGSILDKIKSDFNIGRRDRCVELSWTPGKEDPSVWMDLIAKVKEGIISSFDSHVSVREEEVKRSESQRQLPGWNFCTFFILKESLATSFEGMHLFEDSQIQYDELEASFFQVLKEKNLSWFGKLGGNLPGDDSSPLLSATSKPYRELFLTNSISVFDFRIYLLARQCALLGQMGRVIEVARKASMFIGGFSRTLRESESSLTEHFIESWIYCAALDVVTHCDQLAKKSEVDAASATPFSALKGELLELARNQLDKIGIRVGHLPCTPPFSMSLHESPDGNSMHTDDTESDRPTKITSKDLLTAIKKVESFDTLYTDLTKRAIDMYASAGRRKFARKMHCSLAALDYHRKRYATAYQMFSSLPAHYISPKWTPLEAFMLARALDTHEQLEKPRDRDWITSVLSFLKAWVVVGNAGGSRNMSLPPGMELAEESESGEYLSSLLSFLGAAARELETEMNVPGHPAFVIQVANGNARIANDKDGSYVEVTIKNFLPCDVSVDGVSMLLNGHDTDEVRFSCQDVSLPPGDSTVELFCPIPVSGTFALVMTEIFLAKLHLQWPFQVSSVPTTPTTPSLTYPKASSIPNKQPALVKIPKDYAAVDVKVNLPRQIKLDAPSALLFSIRSGRNQIIKASLKVSGPTGISFRMKDAQVVDGKSTSFGCTSQAISIGGLAEGEMLEITLPHSHPSQGSSVAVFIEFRYDTIESGESISRTLIVTRKIFIGMPVQVNVRDFFRGKSLFSKFTVETHLPQPIRIQSASLDGGSGLTIVSGQPRSQPIWTVTPSKSTSFLFRLDSETERIERETFHFHLLYRTLREEVEGLIAHHLKPALELRSGTRQDEDTVTRRLTTALALNGDWVERYLVTGELVINDIEHDGSPMDEIAEEVVERLRKNDAKERPEDSGDNWRHLTIPVDVPFMNILAAVRIQLPQIMPTDSIPVSAADPATTLHVYAGQPISATLNIHTSFHWGKAFKKKGEGYKMRFDVDQSGNDWLISGRKRGDFFALDQSDHDVPLTLIPLRHGELPLPQILVWPLPLTSSSNDMEGKSEALPSSETYQAHAAERILVLPRGGRSTFVVGMGGDQ